MPVPLAEPLQPGQQAVIAMDFDVGVPNDPETSNYGTFASFDDVLALAQFYPMIAVYDDEGRIVEDDAKESFFGSPRSERAQLFLSKILQH